MELDLTDEQVKAIRLLESIGCTIIFNGEIRKDFDKKICHFTGTCAFQTYSTVPYCNLQADCKYKK